ncbi:hypothetical protein CCP3SC1AL1_1900001 [Gammaproteobacteria bacterium]
MPKRVSLGYHTLIYYALGLYSREAATSGNFRRGVHGPWSGCLVYVGHAGQQP